MEQPLKASRETAEMLRRMIREEMSRAKQRGRVTREHADNFALATMVVKTTGTITARSGTTAGSGTATPQELPDGTLADTASAITVYNLAETSIPQDSYVLAIQELWSGRYVVIPPPSATNPATTRYRGQLQGAMTSANSTHTVDNLIPLDGVGGDTSLTVANIHGWEGDDNAACRIEWNADDEQWEFYQVTCPA